MTGDRHDMRHRRRWACEPCEGHVPAGLCSETRGSKTNRARMKPVPPLRYRTVLGVPELFLWESFWHGWLNIIFI